MKRPVHLTSAQQDSLYPKNDASFDSFDEEDITIHPLLFFLMSALRTVLAFLSVAVFVVGCWAVLEAIR